MRTWTICGLACLLWAGDLRGAEDKPLLEVAPTLAELGSGWTTNFVAYLLDPRSQPSEIDFQGNPATSARLEAQRLEMKTNGRTGCGLFIYGRGDVIMNSGLFRVYVQRWAQTRALHNHWVDWKMNPARVVRTTPAIGEDFFWTEEWWRETRVRQNLVFRRGLFQVTIEAGSESDSAAMVRLGQAIDARIKGRPAAPSVRPPNSWIRGVPKAYDISGRRKKEFPYLQLSFPTKGNANLHITLLTGER